MMATEDIKQVFYEDIRVKKAAGRGGYHKKNGSRTKRMPCSTDYMSQRKWEKMNGDVKTYDMNAPMSWPEFCAMPDDLKDQYIRTLASRFGATKQAICEVFGTNIRSFDKQISGCDFADIFTLGRRITSQGKKDLLAFFHMEPTKDSEPTECSLELPEAADELKTFTMDQVIMEFSGPFDADHVANSLRRFLRCGQPVSIHICCDILGG